jgi:hypothetical protein
MAEDAIVFSGDRKRLALVHSNPEGPELSMPFFRMPRSSTSPFPAINGENVHVKDNGKAIGS